MDGKQSVFLHERLNAYAFARKFYQSARVIREQLPRGLGEVRDQLYRASSSIGHRTSLRLFAAWRGTRCENDRAELVFRVWIRA